jgi:hexosaminidase
VTPRGWVQAALSALALCALPFCPASAADTGVIPAPASVTALDQGRAALIVDGTPILVPARDREALDTAAYLAGVVQRTCGLRLTPQAGGRARSPAIRLRRARGFGSEAYRLETGPEGAVITASTSAGLFYGAVSLWQLLTPGHGAAALAPVRIEDAPRFGWRGMMLDSARHFWTPDQVRGLIDAMALHKLNVLHWHLTDDQGWRLQILSHPRLTEIGAWRTPIVGSADSGAARYGGFYTQAQVREIVAYAARRHIAIVPELDMPGHAVSAILAYPALGAGAPPPARAQSEWGGFPYVYNLDDDTFRFVEDVLGEVMSLFPGRYVHVGGDEAVKERWLSSPAVQARMKAEGIADVTAAQHRFTARIGEFLQAHGRRLVGWDEILQGGALPGDAVVMSWHGVDGATAAVAAGHDAILAPAPILYFDNRQGEGADEPPGRGVLVSLKDVYTFEPAPAAVAPAQAAHILGLQGNLWTEHIRTGDQLQAMAFPRLAAVAETAWSAPGRKDWNGFVVRLPAQFARYEALGIKADRSALAVRVDAEPASQPGRAAITLSAQGGVGEIRYTTDGTPPDAASPRYDAPFEAPLPANLRAGLFIDGRLAAPAVSRGLDANSILSRASEDLKLCNDRLSLNLEGAPPDPRPRYLINPLDPCWIWPAATMDGVTRVKVSFGRLPFMFGLDEAHNSVIVHPPREPSGELEVHQDGCLTEPIVVAALPPGGPGSRGELTALLPVRTGRHDLCFTFTSQAPDPILALQSVQLLTGAPE